MPSEFPQQPLQQNADRIYNIEQANSVNHIVNVTPIRQILSSNEYYNLFIIYNEKYEENSFFNTQIQQLVKSSINSL